MRSDKEIEAEIAKLGKLKTQVPRTTLEGQSNPGCIDKQIEVLQRKMTQDDIFECGTEDNWNQTEIQKANEAAQWLTGERLELADDANGWQSLIENKADGPDSPAGQQ